MYKKIIFIICMLLITCWSFADNFCSSDGITVLASNENGSDRSSAIIASIDGHTLTVIFTQNLGDVTIEVSNEAGFPIDLDLIGTPNGYQCYIPLAGHYTVVYKLDNGDEYSGEYDVTN